jgi:hypothetical protein
VCPKSEETNQEESVNEENSGKKEEKTDLWNLL